MGLGKAGVMGDERRSDDRLDVIWKATMVVDDNSYECEVCDVSLAGTLVKVDAPLEQGMEVLLQIKELGDFAGSVAWKAGEKCGLTLHLGPDMLLKKYAELSGEYPSTRPAPAGDRDPLDLDLDVD